MKLARVIRVAVIVGVIALLEVLCLTGVIDPLTMQAPHLMAVDLVHLLVAGTFNAAILKTFGNAAIAFGLSLVVGVLVGVALFRLSLLRQVLDPMFATYYAVPVFAFYPLLIIIFGLGDAPMILIGFMLAVVAVIVNTMNGLDRVPRVLVNTARVLRLSAWETAWHVMLPFSIPYVLTGVKLAVAYSLIGVIGAEFIMSNGGMGYEISFAYTNFDNATMYPLILLILFVSITLNFGLAAYEKKLAGRRGK